MLQLKNRIIKFEEKNNDNPDSYQYNINAGIYLLDQIYFPNSQINLHHLRKIICLI